MQQLFRTASTNATNTANVVRVIAFVMLLLPKMREVANPVSSANCSKLTCFVLASSRRLTQLTFRELTEASRYRLLTDRCVNGWLRCHAGYQQPGQIIRFCIFCNELGNPSAVIILRMYGFWTAKPSFIFSYQDRRRDLLCSPGKSRDVCH